MSSVSIHQSDHLLLPLSDRCVCRLSGDPVYNTFDGQMGMLSGLKKYTLAKCMIDPLDPCSFNIEVKAGRLLRHQRVKYATSMPRYIDVEINGEHVKLAQNHRAIVRTRSNFTIHHRKPRVVMIMSALSLLHGAPRVVITTI